MRALRANVRGWAGVPLLALVLLSSSLGRCQMDRAVTAADSEGHGCCGAAGITSLPPSCCDTALRAPDAAPRESERHMAAPSAHPFAYEAPPTREPAKGSGALFALLAVPHSPPSILRI